MKLLVDFIPSADVCQVWRVSSHHHWLRFFPSLCELRAHWLLSLEGLLFQEKLSLELLGIAASDHCEHIFPAACFSFQLPGALVVFTFSPCHFILSWKPIWMRCFYPNIFFFVWIHVQPSHHWSLKKERLKILICLVFLFKSSNT